MVSNTLKKDVKQQLKKDQKRFISTTLGLECYMQTCLIPYSSAFLVGSKQVHAHWKSSKGVQ